MPIFGGLTKYVVLEVKGFKDHWHIAWKGDRLSQVHRLPIRENRIKLLTGTDEYSAYALDDEGQFLPIRLIGYGKIGDGKYKGIRLF